MKLNYKKHWLYDKCDQKTFESNLQEHTNRIRNFMDFNEKLLKVAEAVCPRKFKKEGLQGNPWCNEKCQKEVIKRARYRKTMQKNKTFKNI